MKFSNKTYDVLVWVAQIFLPAIATLYVGLAELWHLPCGTEIGATIMLLDTFLGTCLKISKANYDKIDTEAEGLAQLFIDEQSDDYIGEKFGGVEDEQ